MNISLTLIFLIGFIVTSLLAWNNPRMLEAWIMNPYRVNRRKEYYRFLSSGFVHGNTLHLFFNGFVFYMFGGPVEQVYVALHGVVLGKMLFSLLFLLGIIVSEIPTYWKYKELPHYNSLGASGGVASILFSYVLFAPTADLCLYGLLCLPGFIWAVAYLIYSYYMAKQSRDHVNHDAHFYGALFGVVFTIGTYPEVVIHFINSLTSWNGF
jgi:membrane associated rhomboid family serine protease